MSPWLLLFLGLGLLALADLLPGSGAVAATVVACVVFFLGAALYLAGFLG